MDNTRPATGYPAPNANCYAAPNANGYAAPNIAYPYSAPPPAQYSYPPYYHAPPPNRRKTLLRSIVVAAVSVIVILGCALLIFWLVVRPRIPEFRLISLSVSNFSAKQSQVTGNWDAALEAYNPNKKMSVSYYDVVSGIYYDDRFLTRTELPPFRQETRDTTPLSAKFSMVDSYVDGKVTDSINAERASGNVKFSFRMEATAGFKYGRWRTRRRLIRVWCADLPVNVSSKGSGSLVGGARNCRVVLGQVSGQFSVGIFTVKLDDLEAEYACTLGSVMRLFWAGNLMVCAAVSGVLFAAVSGLFQGDYAAACEIVWEVFSVCNEGWAVGDLRQCLGCAGKDFALLLGGNMARFSLCSWREFSLMFFCVNV